MMCTPESVTTAWLSSPTCQKIGSIKLSFLTCRPKVASSKGFCICPGPNIPRSPPFLALLQSLNSLASSFQRCNSSVVNSDVPQTWPPLPQFWLCTQQVSEEPPPENKGCCVSKFKLLLQHAKFQMIMCSDTESVLQTSEFVGV